MAEYIDREALIHSLCILDDKMSDDAHVVMDNVISLVESCTAVDVVPVSAYQQAVWERDTALSQLKEIGKGLGEKMDDVAPVKHGKWIYPSDISGFGRCSECKSLWDYSLINNRFFRICPICPNCGVRMDDEA